MGSKKGVYDVTYEASAEKDESMKEHVKKVMNESLVLGVSNILGVKHPVRKIVKTLVLLSCIIGFFYQTTEFMQYFLEYPTFVEFDTSFPQRIVLPTITVCERPRIFKWDFCRKYPDRCEPPQNQTEYCKHHSSLCHSLRRIISKIAIPTENSINVIRKANEYYYSSELLKDMTDIISKEEPVLRMFIDYEYADGERIRSKERFEKKTRIYNSQLFHCFSWNMRVNSSLLPLAGKISDVSEETAAMKVKYSGVAEDDSLVPDIEELIFAVHSPFTYINPMKMGKVVNPGYTHSATIRLKETVELEAPYASNCTNYEALWEEDQTHPRSRKMCIEKCMYENVQPICNCSVDNLYYQKHLAPCPSHYDCYTKNAFEILTKEIECNEKCNIECVKIDYVYSFNSIKQLGRKDKNTDTPTYIHIFFEKEMKHFRKQPKYEFVEIFSSLGGFADLWLGMALISVADFLEVLLVIVLFKRKSRKKPVQGENDGPF